MKLNTNIKINPIREGMNLLGSWFSVLTGKMLSKPVSVNLLPTIACNSRCVICDSWKMRETGPRIDLETYKKLAREMKEMKIPYVTVGGGEPLLLKDIYELLKVFRDEGISIQLTTNGYKVDEEICERFIGAGVNRLTFSIDSHISETYQKIRGVDWCDHVLTNLSKCIINFRDRLSVETNSVVCSLNVETFIDTLEFFVERGVNKICFSAVTISDENYLASEDKEDLVKIDLGRARKLTADLLKIKKRYPKRIAASSQFIKGIAKYVENPRQAIYPCYAGFLTLDILYNGDVYSCGNLPMLGNIKNSSLKDIWFSKEAMKNRLAMASKNCPSCYTSCKIELALLGSPARGISYCLEKLKEAI